MINSFQANPHPPSPSSPTLTLEDQALSSKALSCQLSPDDYRLLQLQRILDGHTTPGQLIKDGVAQRLNVVFDIDHTLVHSVTSQLVVQGLAEKGVR